MSIQAQVETLKRANAIVKAEQNVVAKRGMFALVETRRRYITLPDGDVIRSDNAVMRKRSNVARDIFLCRHGESNSGLAWLVSRDGDLWRWDGFSVAANAPTGAARLIFVFIPEIPLLPE